MKLYQSIALEETFHSLEFQKILPFAFSFAANYVKICTELRSTPLGPPMWNSRQHSTRARLRRSLPVGRPQAACPPASAPQAARLTRNQYPQNMKPFPLTPPPRPAPKSILSPARARSSRKAPPKPRKSGGYFIRGISNPLQLNPYR